MTMFERIKSMTIDELAEWISKYSLNYETPWIDWFDNTYCQNCESEIIDIGDRKMKCSWCELHNKCRYFQDLDDTPDVKQIIKLWLEKE